MADTSSVPQTVSDTVSKVLGTLADKFGATGGHLWEVYVQYVYSHAVVNTVLDLIMFAICVGILFKVSKIYTWMKSNCETESKYSSPNPAPAIGSCILVMVTVIFGIIAFISLSNDMVGVFSPEGAALSQIIEQLK